MVQPAAQRESRQQPEAELRPSVHVALPSVAARRRRARLPVPGIAEIALLLLYAALALLLALAALSQSACGPLPAGFEAEVARTRSMEDVIRELERLRAEILADGITARRRAEREVWSRRFCAMVLADHEAAAERRRATETGPPEPPALFHRRLQAMPEWRLDAELDALSLRAERLRQELEAERLLDHMAWATVQAGLLDVECVRELAAARPHMARKDTGGDGDTQ